MEILDLEPNTKEWEQARLTSFNASEAPAMMNCSKYMSRNELIELKKTGVIKPVDEFTQKLFDKGHEAEAKARVILEIDELEDFMPLVVRSEVDGLMLQASLDGYGTSSFMPWEHKLWNETLAENVRNNVLEPHYYWQLEHQMLAAGVDKCIFMVSDGTRDNREQMIYYSDPARREQLIIGWHIFKEDLENYEVKAKIEAVEGKETTLPSVIYSVTGSEISSNITNYLADLKYISKHELSRKLETDQDFADKDNFNKAVKQARVDLKEITKKIREGFSSFAEFENFSQEADSILQKMQSHGEKQVKDAKEAKKKAVVSAAELAISEFVNECNSKIEPLNIINVCDIRPDFTGAMKGKRTIESIENAVNGVITQTKIDIQLVMDNVGPNLKYLQENAKDYKFLFGDTNQIVTIPPEQFVLIVNSRISEHKEAEEKRIKAEAEKLAEAERERIRQEEKVKAEAEAKKKADEERKAEADNQPEKALVKEQVIAISKLSVDSDVASVSYKRTTNEKDKVYKIRADWAGYIKGYSLYEIQAKSEYDAKKRWKQGKEIEHYVCKNNVKTKAVSILN